MKIFYYCLEYPTPMYLWQRANIIGDLRRAGHEVIHFNPATYGSMDAANEAAAAALRSTHGIDLLMTCDDSDTVYPETVREVAKLGIPSLMIAWDNLELPYKQKAIAPLFDAVWLTSDETRYLFERWGCRNVIFAPYACSPYTYGPVETVPVRSVGFIGSPYGSRTNKLNHLTSGGVDVDVYANVLFDKGYTSSSATGRKEFSPRDIMVKASRYMRFPIGRKVFAATIINKLSPAARLDTGSEHFHAHRSVSHEEMCRLYSAHTLSLNITELRDTYVLSQPIPKLHLRTFEIPMCGGLQLTSRNPEIEQYFEDGREIVLYDSREEMIDKARWYLDPARDTEVARMKAAARTRAEREHTWMARLNPIFASLGLNH